MSSTCNTVRPRYCCEAPNEDRNKYGLLFFDCSRCNLTFSISVARASGSREFSCIMARCLDSAFFRRDRRHPHLSKLARVAGKDSKVKFFTKLGPDSISTRKNKRRIKMGQATFLAVGTGTRWSAQERGEKSCLSPFHIIRRSREVPGNPASISSACRKRWLVCRAMVLSIL